jgi:AcrR family transcriptional regulator
MDTKSRILHKAEQIARNIGFRAVTMDELAFQLGISKKTIYQFYTDKNEIVDDVMTEIIRKSQTNCLANTSQADNAIHEIFVAMAQVKKDFENLNPIIIHDLEKYFPKTYEKFKEHKFNFIYKLIYENLVRGMSQGYYRPVLNADILAKFRIESMLLGFNQSLFPKDQYKLTEVTQIILDHFLHGIATPEGLKLIEKYKTE